MPLVGLLENGERAIDEVIDVMGRATVEAVPGMSAEQVAGPKEQGRRDADRELYLARGAGSRACGVEGAATAGLEAAAEEEAAPGRRIGEVEVPAYTALQAGGGWPTGCWS